MSGAALVAVMDKCRARFDAARWQALRADLALLDARLEHSSDWQRMLADLGNNSPPGWNVFAGALARHLPVSHALLDYWPWVDQALLLLLVPYVVWRVFGAPAALAYGLLFCSNPLAPLGWTGGSFCRADWYVALVLGLAALHSRRVGLAGGLLAVAATLRVFPALFALAACAAALLAGQWRDARRFALVGLAIAALCAALATLAYGVDRWREFAAVMHLRISPYGMNTIGLTKLAASWNVMDWPHFAGGPEALATATQWVETQRGDEAARRGVTLVIGLALGGAAALGLARLSLVAGTVLGGCTFMFLLLTPCSYYHVVLACLPLAAATPAGAAGAALLAVSALAVLALRVESVPFASAFGRELVFGMVSFRASAILLASLVALWTVVAVVRLRAAATTGERRVAGAMLLGVALSAALGLAGYQAAPSAPAYFVSLAGLGAARADAGVTLTHRTATASWPGADFYELEFAAGARRFVSTLAGLPAGRYRAAVIATRAPGYGSVSFNIARKQAEFDGRSGTVGAAPVQLELGTVTLGATSEFRIDAPVGRTTRIGVSGLVLEPLTAP